MARTTELKQRPWSGSKQSAGAIRRVATAAEENQAEANDVGKAEVHVTERAGESVTIRSLSKGYPTELAELLEHVQGAKGDQRPCSICSKGVGRPSALTSR